MSLTTLHVMLERGGLVADFKCDGDKVAALKPEERAIVLADAFNGAVAGLKEALALTPNVYTKIPSC